MPVPKTLDGADHEGKKAGSASDFHHHVARRGLHGPRRDFKAPLDVGHVRMHAREQGVRLMRGPAEPGRALEKLRAYRLLKRSNSAAHKRRLASHFLRDPAHVPETHQRHENLPGLKLRKPALHAETPKTPALIVKDSSPHYCTGAKHLCNNQYPSCVE